MILLCVSNLITYSRHDLSELYQLMGYPPAQLRELQSLPLTRKNVVLWSLLFTVPFLAYLLYVRKFLKEEPPSDRGERLA